MRTLTTEEIAKALGGTALGHAEITSVVIDNREVKPGSLFIAIKGERLDGHQFVKSAIDAGAAALLVHEDIGQVDVPVIKVSDTSEAFLGLARYYRSLFDIPVVGLTGSVGKTTTKEMIWTVLSSKYNTHKTEGNLNNNIGVPKVLLRLEKEHEAAVIEMGMNHKGEIHTLTTTALPTLSVITNIGVAHIENLKSREGILNAKLEILDGMKEGSTLIVNGDNDLLKELDLKGKYKIRRFGIYEENDIKAEDIEYLPCSTNFKLCIDGKTEDVKLPSTGEHHVYDALAAFSVGYELGIPLCDMAKAIETYVPVGLREKIEVINGVTLIEDCYNASPDSIKALSNTLRIKGETAQRKIAVIADMLELGDYSEEAHRNCGKYLADAKVDMLLTYGELAKYVADEAKKQGVLRVFEFDNKEELSKHLASIVRAGDVVAFKGSRGMKLEEVIDLVKGELK